MSHPPPIPSRASRGELALSRPELVAWGERLGRALEAPIVLTMTGDLGAGKTTLVQAICRGYGVIEEVTSPTYTIVHEYAGGPAPVIHIDLYRLESEQDLDGIGFDELLARDAVVIVEWADRAAGRIPSGHIPIELAHLPDQPDLRLLYAGGHT